jgi:hypothetical protein
LEVKVLKEFLPNLKMSQTKKERQVINLLKLQQKKSKIHSRGFGKQRRK